MMRNPELDPYFEKANAPWQLEMLNLLREVMLNCGLKETKKWGGPVYVHHGNVVSIGAFKHHVSIWFFEGAHLSDHAGVLAAAQEKTRGMRQWRFEQASDFDPALVRQYVMEARENDGKGVRTAPSRSKELVIPQELEDALTRSSGAMAAFDRMPLSHRREHAEHVAGAKREETRLRRAEKCLDMILRGEGLHDRYR